MAEESKEKQKKGQNTCIMTLLAALEYPGEAPEGAVEYTMRVDGMEMQVRDTGDRMVMSYMMTDDETLLPKLAEYAAGRLLREEATLAWNRGAILWQDAPADADAHDLKRAFETFADACDWWRERVEDLHNEGGPSPSPFPDVMIRP